MESIKFEDKFSGGRSNPYILSVNVSGPVETDQQQEALFVAISMTLQQLNNELRDYPDAQVSI